MKTTTTTVKSWGGVTPEDETLVYRVVGTLEYLSALRNLDAFVESASNAEIAVADKLVQSSPQFSVFTRLAGRSDQSTAGGQSAIQKKGLAWVVALARLEAGAILGTFTNVSSPFEIVGPTRLEMPSYKALLMEGAQAHAQAFLTDPNLTLVVRKVPDSEVLAYLRRLKLVRAMLDAAARSNAPELTAQDWSLLMQQDRQLVAARNHFSTTLAKYVAAQNYSKTDRSETVGEQHAVVRACGAQLRGEAHELAAGTARMQHFAVK